MALYTLSDTHLSFQTAKPMDIFGARWQDHAEKIQKNWRSLITPEDTVIVPGDITWAMTTVEAVEDFAFLDSLPGHKIICGTRGWYNDGVSPKECDYQKIVAREGGRLTRSLQAGKALEEGELIAFLHFPPVFGDFVCRPLLDILHAFDVKRVYFGHIHGVYNLPSHFDYESIRFTIVSADYLNFVPLRVF